MENVQAVKVGSTVNVFLNGRLYKKSFDTSEAAKTFFHLVLKLKETQNEELLHEIYGVLNKKMLVAKANGLEYDLETGNVFLAGFKTPVPNTLVSVIEDYHENGFPKEPIINFWKLLMANPDKRVRESLFGFVEKHDFSLTTNGYMVVYKAVEPFDEDNVLRDFVKDALTTVRKNWKTSPSRYVVYFDKENDEYHFTKKETFEKWDLNTKNVKFVGGLKELEEQHQVVHDNVFIPTYVKSNLSRFSPEEIKNETVRLGVPVKKQRKECDSDPAIDCSNGLHVGATSYVKNFGNSGNVLVCLVNPMNVIAVPNYDHSKMRVCEYFPYALVKKDRSSNFEIVEQSYFENDYLSYEKEELERQIEAIKNEESPIVSDNEKGMETRDFEELMKIVQSRMVDLSV